MIHPRHIWISLFLILLYTSAYCGQLRIIELKHRTADEIIRIVRSQLGPDDTISGKGYVVFLTAADENVTRIESIIRTLDAPSRQLLITVVQGENAREALASVDISGNVSIGDNARVEFGRNPQPDNTVAVKGRSSETRKNNVDIQRLRAQEGLPAFIYIGQLVPVSTRTVAPQSRQNRTAFRETKTGVRLVARLSGDRFVLDIETQRDIISPTTRGAVATQQIQTQVHGRVGEWVDIGGVIEAGQWRESGIAYSDENRRQRQRPVFIRVNEIAR